MFFIRADGNEMTGAGHIMRCLTIGAELVKLVPKEEVLFLCADEKSAGLVRQQEFHAFVLGTDYCDMASELSALENVFDKSEDLTGKAVGTERDCRPVILVDSYYVTDEYLKELRSFGVVVLMDDMGKKKYPADAVINYNVTACPKDYRRHYEGTGTKLLLGSAYVPVREQFLNRNYQIREEAKTVLITSGGGDSENIAGRLLQALFDENMEFHVTAGRFNPHYETLKQLEDRHKNIYLHCNVSDMAGLMAAADIAVTAGGSTIYELASLGVPFICFSCAENQEPLTEYIHAHNIAGFGGAFHRDSAAAMTRTSSLFRELITDADLRRQYHRSEKELADGHGAERLALALTELR